jgi:hypothetical protein
MISTRTRLVTHPARAEDVSGYRSHPERPPDCAHPHRSRSSSFPATSSVTRTISVQSARWFTPGGWFSSCVQQCPVELAVARPCRSAALAGHPGHAAQSGIQRASSSPDRDELEPACGSSRFRTAEKLGCGAKIADTRIPGTCRTVIRHGRCRRGVKGRHCDIPGVAGRSRPSRRGRADGQGGPGSRR